MIARAEQKVEAIRQAKQKGPRAESDRRGGVCSECTEI